MKVAEKELGSAEEKAKSILADAEKAAKELLKDLPENPDCHRIIGLCAGEQGRKQEALQHLRKAQELVDENVEAYIEKYSK